MNRIRIVQRFFKTRLLYSLKGKLILSFLAISIIPLAIVVTLAFLQFQEALRLQTSNQLAVVRDLKIKQVETYLRQIEQDIRLAAELPGVKTAMQQLAIAVRGQGLNQVREMGFLGRPDLFYLEAYSPYAVYHAKYHAFFRELVQTKGYADIWLVTPEGDIIYTFAKRNDFATNLLQATYQDTAPAQLFQDLLANAETDQVQMTDYVSYPPAGDIPVGFIGVPILDEGKFVGNLIYELPLDQINDLMQVHTGFWKTGETYLVGADKLLRTKTRLGKEINFFGQKVDTLAVQKGLMGESGVAIIEDYRGIPVLSAYQALVLKGFRWVLLAEVDRSEAFDPSNRLRNLMLIIIVITTLAVIGVGIYIGRSIAEPIAELAETSTQIASGNLQLRAKSGARDEIGHFAKAFNIMTNQLQASIVSLEQRVAELHRSNQALRESEDKFNRAFMLGPDLISIYRMNDGKYIDVNDNLIKISGYCRDEVIGKTTEEIRIWDDPDARELFITKLEDKGEVNNYETNFKINDGSLIPCLVSARPIEIKGEKCIISIARDISERKRAEAKERLFEAHLQQSRKMEAVGVLAGGIAHEFNNALAVVVGNIELLQLGLPDHENVLKFGHDIKTAVRRMSNLTDQLLAYARGGKYRPEIINLSDFVSNTLEILKHDVDPEISIETDFSNKNSHVNADLTQLQTVLSVIVTNAKEAIEGKGQLRVTTGDTVFDDENVPAFLGLKAGKYTYLTIEDNGRGMDEETKNRIYEPFFTTKFQGRGLGMAAVYGIVKNHDGYINIDSEPGKGTAIRIFLPSVDIVEKEAKSTEPELRLGSGTVLVIEDEEMVLDVTQAMLEKLGYRVLCARTGKEAIGITNTFDGDIDIALLDIKLPDMEGGRIYPIIKEYRPNMKVVVCSGYSSDGPAREILNAGAHGFIKKPFVFKELLIKIRSLLE